MTTPQTARLRPPLPESGSSRPASRADLRACPRRLRDAALRGATASAVALSLAALALFLGITLLEGLPRLGWRFLTSFPSHDPMAAGVLPAFAGSAALLALAAVVAVPLGVGAAIWFEEYARPGRLTRLLQMNLEALASVPSVLYGLLGLEVFVHGLGLGRTLASGAGTLALLMLPVIVIAAREALRAVPPELREACLALGAGPWATLRRAVLPAALPGILTGVILALARVAGEAAPLIALGALSYVGFLPSALLDGFTALPVQIFAWASRPHPGFRADAAAAALTLVGLMLLLNVGAVWIRARLQRRTEW